MVKNPNWQEADQLAIYKHDQGGELGITKNKECRFSLLKYLFLWPKKLRYCDQLVWSEWDLNL